MNKTLKSAIQMLKTNPLVNLEATKIATAKTGNEAKVRQLRTYLELGPEVKITIINSGGKRGFKIEGKEKTALVEESLSYETTVS